MLNSGDDLFSLRPYINDHMREIDRLTDEVKFLRQTQVDQLAQIYQSVEKSREIVQEGVADLKSVVRGYTNATNIKIGFLAVSFFGCATVFWLF